MPSRNVVKTDVDDGYYHVYARGHNKQRIFIDEEDYRVFLNLIKRYLSRGVVKNRNGIIYPNFYKDIELLCFCLMQNHFHLAIYQSKEGSMSGLMQCLLTSYSRYFNKKYNRRGPLFETRYKASLISNEYYLLHVSRYIHLNPNSWQDYQYSSLPYYFGEKHANWIQPHRMLSLFSGREEYFNFLLDYEDYKAVLEEVKYELAHTIQ